MTWKPTNANDVSLIVSQVERDDGQRVGTSRIVDTGRLVVDEFSIDTDEDLSALSGVGNDNPLGISGGDVEHTFSFTVQGEDAELFQQLATGDSQGEKTRSVELEIVAQLDDVSVTLTGARAGTRNLSGSSGDPIEFEVEGMATGKRMN